MFKNKYLGGIFQLFNTSRQTKNKKMEGDIENEIFEFLNDFSFKLEEKEAIENKVRKKLPSMF